MEYKLFIDDELCVFDKLVQVRFPKTKKKRIRNKWAKRRINFKWKTFHKAIVIADYMFVSSKFYNEVKNKQNEN